MNGGQRSAVGIVKAQQQSASSSSSPVTSEIISVAHELADAAAAVTTPYFRTSVPVDIKTDASPVTIADRQAEIAMRAVISSRFPSHAIFGEEQGYTPGASNNADNGDYMWVIDPIDGTKSFITGKPLFGTLIALLHNGRPVLGIIDQPILKERWLGISGQPTTLNNTPISTRSCTEVGSAYMYATTPHMFSGESELAFNRLRDQVRIPLYGCDCYAYGLLAAGHCDLVAEADLKPYDYMALIPVIQGAGGIITDWKGKELCWSSQEAAQGVAPPGEVLAAGDSTCHTKALELLAWK
jgi:inositol-phosphate phosphatase/L-galactose 1-phosphate phosphatase/histidinol-phosphatase